MPKSIHEGWDFIRNKPMFSPPKWLTDEEPKPLFEDGGCDLIIVIGTALAVTPFNSTIFQVPNDCPKVLINLTNPKEFVDFDNLVLHPERLLL